MKNKKLLTFTFATALAFAAVSFASCSITGGETTQLSGSMTIVVDAQEEGVSAKTYTVDLSEYTNKDRVDDVLDDLAETESFYYEGYNGVYGMYYTALGYQSQETGNDYYTTTYILQQDAAAGKYVYIYTSVVSDQDTSDYKSTVEYSGKTLVSSAVGASSMHLEDGAVVYFTYIVYSW